MQPCHLDHAAFAFVGQMAVEGIVGAFEHDQVAVERLDLRRDEVIDIIGALEKTKTASVGIRPGLVQVEQGRGNFGFAVGMDGAVALVEGTA